MKKKLFAFLICVCVLTALLPTWANAESADRVYIYVSLDGNDSAAGDINSPLASFIGARNRIRKLKKDGVTPAKGFVVYLRGGNYQIKESVVFTPEDSGTDEAPIVYRAYPGEEVTVIGGASLSESVFKPLTDANIKNRIIDGNAKSKVLCADLKALGFSYFGEIYMPGAYTYQVPGTVKPAASSPELFINGKVMTVARYPNDGFMTIDKVVDIGATPVYWRDDHKGTENYVPEDERDATDTFELKSDDKRYLKWADVPENEALLYGFFYYTWADATAPLKRVDLE